METLTKDELFTFTQPEAIRGWISVDDGVMGGVSRSEILLSDQGHAIFQGEVSLVNNGGFCSVRSPRLSRSLAGIAGFQLRIRGDGRQYAFYCGVPGWRPDSYRCRFECPAHTWTELTFPLDRFEPVRFGQVIAAGPLDPARIRTISFLIAEKQAGEFRLEIEWVRLIRVHSN